MGPLQIAEGDRLKFRIPMSGESISVNVYGVYRVGPEGVEVYTDYYRQHGRRIPTFLRNIRTEWITHQNGQKVGLTHKQRTIRSRVTQEAPELAQAGQSGEEDAMVKLRTTTRKSLDDMSEAHRKHIEKWEPHLEALRGEHVWAAVSRTPGRGTLGPVYVALKRSAKDYIIADYDTEKRTPVTPSRVLSEYGSSSELLTAFREFRQKAKDERAQCLKDAAKSKPKKTAPKKAAAKKAAPKKAAVKRPAAKKATPKKATPRKQTAKKLVSTSKKPATTKKAATAKRSAVAKKTVTKPVTKPARKPARKPAAKS